MRTVDSDLVVILLGFMGTFLDIDPNISILIDYGMMKRRLIRVNDCYNHLGASISSAMMFSML